FATHQVGHRLTARSAQSFAVSRLPAQDARARPERLEEHCMAPASRGRGGRPTPAHADSAQYHELTVPHPQTVIPSHQTPARTRPLAIVLAGYAVMVLAAIGLFLFISHAGASLAPSAG